NQRKVESPHRSQKSPRTKNKSKRQRELAGDQCTKRLQLQTKGKHGGVSFSGQFTPSSGLQLSLCTPSLQMDHASQFNAILYPGLRRARPSKTLKPSIARFSAPKLQHLGE